MKNQTAHTDAKEMLDRLSLPFDPIDVKWKPQAVSGNRALAIAFVDVRAVSDRLDEVLGMDNWQDAYEVLEQGSVACRLQVRVNGEWIEKQDVGSPSEQPDEGDRMKAAYSDALKRAAVKFGVGRYLYRLPKQWADYDTTRKQFVTTPQLPEWARPSARSGANTARQTKGVATVRAMVEKVASVRKTTPDQIETAMLTAIGVKGKKVEALTVPELTTAFKHLDGALATGSVA
jgi:hypothetical protein